MQSPGTPKTAPTTILVDADACPVKDEIYRVAERHGAMVRIVSNSPFRVPQSPMIKRVLVDDSFDAADDWIAEEAERLTAGVSGDVLGGSVSGGEASSIVVITADILLAQRCLKAGATVLAHNGKPFDAANIGNAIATRAIMEDLRAGMDGIGGGPPPFGKADRSRFLQALDGVLVRLG